MMMSDFESYFSNVYTSEWEALYTSLQAPESQICYSAFTHTHPQEVFKNLKSLTYTDHEQASQRHAEGHIQNYILDPASLAPVVALDIRPFDQVLDLCAAPGGKSLALLSSLSEEGFLISNDSSESRFHRLRKVLKQYTPATYKAPYKVLHKDGTRFGFYHAQEFSRILIDVPCSSERHHIHQNTTSQWSFKKSKHLAVKQYTLLCAALLCAQPGATLVYSTCSINPVENDGVIAKFLKKKKDFAELDVTPAFTELGSRPTEFGQMILPHTQGYGPIYYCKLKVK